MTFTSIGDLAQSFQLRRESARLDTQLQRLTTELSSGRREDLGATTAGDFGPLAAMERDLTALGAYESAVKEAVIIGRSAEDVLSRIGQDSEDAAAILLQARTVTQPALVENAAADARTRFEAAVSGLNATAAGRSLFAGQAFGTPPLPSADSILADLFADVSGSANVPDLLSAIDAWFAPGGTFELSVYQGSQISQSVRVGANAEVSTGVTALDPGVVETLKAFATAALVTEGVFAGQPQARAEIVGEAGLALLSASDALTATRARIGDQTGAALAAQSRIAGERSAVEIARNEIVGIDEYDTAIALRETEAQLETLYTLTSRISALSLVNFLR